MSRPVGRPRSCPDEVLDLVKTRRRAGQTYESICNELNRAGVPTPAGRSRWYPSYVYRLLRTRGADFDDEAFRLLDRRRGPRPSLPALDAAER